MELLESAQNAYKVSELISKHFNIHVSYGYTFYEYILFDNRFTEDVKKYIMKELPDIYIEDLGIVNGDRVLCVS